MKEGRTKIIEEKIEICGYCEGYGVVYVKDTIGSIKYSKWNSFNDRDKSFYSSIKCNNCNGLGKILKTTTIEWTTLE